MDRRTVLRGALVAGAGLSAAALIGCGSNDDAGTTTTPALATPSTATTPAASDPGTTFQIPANAKVPTVSGAPKPGGTWTIPTTSTHGQRDMHTALGQTPWHNISELAFETNEWTMELRGVGVEEWEILDDQGLELAMHVRPGLTMHNKAPWNGRDFNAEDLAFNLERNAGLFAEREGIPLTSFQRRSMVEGLQSAEAVDERTVIIKMARPNGALFNGMAEIRTQLMPKEIVDIGFDDPTKFSGFGAYECTEFRVGERETYERHANYYGSAHFDKMERVVIPDRASTLAAFIDGQVSVIAGPLLHEVQTAQQVARESLFYEWTHPNWDHFRWNLANEALADPRVRHAFWLATDRREINDGYYGPGWGWAAAGHPEYPETWGQDKVQTLPGYNPATKDADRAEAARLLEAAGYARGAGIELIIVPTVAQAYEEHSLRFKAQMETLFPQIRIEVQRPSDQPAFATRQAARDFSAICYTITVVPDVFLEWHSQYHSDGSRNYGSFEEPESDALIERGLRALNMEERNEVAEEFQTKFVNEWWANLILNVLPERYLLQGNIGGFESTAGTWGWTTYRLSNKARKWYYV